MTAVLDATSIGFSPDGEVWADGGRRNVVVTSDAIEIHGKKYRYDCAFFGHVNSS